MGKLLDSYDHHCFHSPRANVHTHPDLNHCLSQNCPGAISKEMATQAGYADDDGNVKCPLCNGHTHPSGERKVVEVHAKLCTDPTIHYPEWRKTGKVDEEDFQAWKATLTRDELLGHYKRVEDIYVSVQLRHDDAALLGTDPDAFNRLLNQRLRERAEIALLHQAPHRHKTTTTSISL